MGGIHSGHCGTYIHRNLTRGRQGTGVQVGIDSEVARHQTLKGPLIPLEGATTNRKASILVEGMQWVHHRAVQGLLTSKLG